MVINETQVNKKNETKINHVKYVWIISDGNLSECPYDRKSLFPLQSELEYSKDKAGGYVVSIPVKLRYCSFCQRWFISHQQLIDFQKKNGLFVSGFDILGSAEFPRPAAYMNWHPTAMVVIDSKDELPERAQPKRNSVGSKHKDMNLAFKYRYCDGGKNGQQYGFRGICSEHCFEYNAGSHSTAFCAYQGAICRDYSEQDLDENNYPCYESVMLKQWFCCAGNDLNESSTKPRFISQNRSGFISLVTTQLPDEGSDKRRIFAIFQIGSQENTESGTFVRAEQKLRLEMMRDEPLYFWDYYQNSSNPGQKLWGSGLYRNISNDMVILVLRDAVDAIKDQYRKSIAQEMFNLACKRVGKTHLEELLS